MSEKRKVKVGHVYGDMKCIEKLNIKQNSHPYYYMECTVCGYRKNMVGSNILANNGVSHKSHANKIYVGDIYGDMECIYDFGKAHRHYYIFKCKVCGYESKLDRDMILTGKAIHHTSKHTKKLLNMSDQEYKHLYQTYNNINGRVNNIKHQHYHLYGGRGIQNEFIDFDHFIKTMYSSYKYHIKLYGRKDTTLDRIDNNKNYSPDNCRWATNKLQVENRRITKCFEAISPDGEKYISNNQTQFALDHNLSQHCISNCLVGKTKKHRGWTFKYI